MKYIDITIKLKFKYTWILFANQFTAYIVSKISIRNYCFWLEFFFLNKW